MREREFMGHWLDRNIIAPGKLPLLLALTAFVLTFLVTRVITRLIRAGRGGPSATSGRAGCTSTTWCRASC
ncbi:hypothetical protein GCM10020000_58710 [Streptomyces olivoverticillatus]